MIRAFLGAAFAACLLASVARAEERITDYASDIAVAPTGVLTVNETVTVNAEGNAIRHGIFRDFPTAYTNRNGLHVHTGFTVLSVSVDGAPEAYTVDAITAGKRVKIGDIKRTISPGKHRFVLTYRTDRQVGFFPYYDELYWNVTGNFWRFPIDHASARIALPPGADIRQFAFYTGPAGATARNARAEKSGETAIFFETTKPLGAAEGLTVAVGFAKGVIAPPSPAQHGIYFLRDNASTIAALGGAAAFFIFVVAAWLKYGRDPKPGTIIPRFAPPDSLPPAAVRFIYNMEYDRKIFAAAIVNMAVKGYLKITKAGTTYILSRTGKDAAETSLARNETAIAAVLFPPGGTPNTGRMSLELKQANHATVAAAISALKSALTAECIPLYFSTNLGWFMGAASILALAAVATPMLSDDPNDAAFLALFPSACALAATWSVHHAWQSWRAMTHGAGLSFRGVFKALNYSIITLLALAGAVLGCVIAVQARIVPVVAVMALAAGVVAAYIFRYLLRAPTALGAKARDEIEGFRMFLATAEQNRLEVLQPPEITPAVFERFLPYAIALDCENAWSRKFAAAAEAAGQSPGASTYSPGWYSGSSSGSFSPGNFSGALGASLAAAASSAAASPGSSSGSGGGGSSGGGGGGGGGGGW